MTDAADARPRRPDTVRLQRLAKGFWESAVLMAGVELGLFTALARGDDTVARAAESIGVSELNAERLLTAATALELVALEGDRFVNAPDVARFLVKGEATYAGPWMLFSKPRWAEWGRLAELLRAGGPPKLLGMYAEGFTVERARRYHEATYSIGMGAGRRFCRQVDLSARSHLIDLGGGSGCYCIVACKTWPRLAATVLDLPPVVEVTAEFVAEHGLSERVAAQACDFTADPLPKADAAIMASNLPQYNADMVQQVVDKVFATLTPGGEFHLIGEMLDDDRSGPIAPALWGLSEAVSGSTGRAHSVGECRGYFAEAGFEKIGDVEFIPGTLTRLTGIKPG